MLSWSRRGFTLVELMIVIFIIAGLTALMRYRPMRFTVRTLLGLLLLSLGAACALASGTRVASSDPSKSARP